MKDAQKRSLQECDTSLCSQAYMEVSGGAASSSSGGICAAPCRDLSIRSSQACGACIYTADGPAGRWAEDMQVCHLNSARTGGQGRRLSLLLRGEAPALDASEQAGDFSSWRWSLPWQFLQMFAWVGLTLKAVCTLQLAHSVNALLRLCRSLWIP